MKLTILTSLLIFTLPAFASDANTPYTSAFNGITTVDAAYEKYNEVATQIIKDAEEAGATKKEIKQLEQIRDDVLAKKSASDKDGKTPTESELTPEEQEQKIAELRENADAMKEKEQSLENKLLGAAGIGATGMGGMQLASGLAEQNADADAEQAMRAYLATFTCKYGDKRVSGGEMDVELPGGNELIGLYSEYVNLANDLKVRKSALGMKAGIESESILDSAKSGLYDDAGLEPRTGAYASLARALSDPNGEDAKMWAAQKEKTAEQVKAGAITAGIGAAGSLVANLAINANAPKERSAEINKKYAKLRQTLKEIQEEVDEVEDPTCAALGKTGTYPECTCPNNQIEVNETCRACGTNEEVSNNTCVKKACSLSPSPLVTEDCGCKGKATKASNKCTCPLTGAVNASECICDTNATQNGNTCTCNSDFKEESGVCVQKIAENKKIYHITIPTDKFFAVNQATLIDAQKQELITSWQTKLNETLTIIEKEYDAAANKDKICLLFTGHTDHTGEANDNKTLSEQRANTLASLFTYTGTDEITFDKKTIGLGETQCPAEAYPQEKLHECRHVDIKFIFGDCDEISESNITRQILGNGVSIGKI